MKSKRGPRIALYTKRSVLDRFSELGNSRVAALLDRADPTVANLRAAHEEHVATVDEVKKAMAAIGANVTRVRRRAHIDTRGFDLVVTVGGDGTLLHASHNVGRVPVLGINSAPSTSVGFFCGTAKGGVLEALRAAVKGELAHVVLNRMQVMLNDEVLGARVLNDALFCHMTPAATSRYILEHGDTVEEQKSSGFWIGPAAGSTAAQRSAGGKVLPLKSKQLQLVVREPYRPHGAEYKLTRFLIKPGQAVSARSKSRKMRLYLDGPDHMVKVDIGDVLRFSQSPEPLKLLGISRRRSKKS